MFSMIAREAFATIEQVTRVFVISVTFQRFSALEKLSGALLSDAAITITDLTNPARTRRLELLLEVVHVGGIQVRDCFRIATANR